MTSVTLVTGATGFIGSHLTRQLLDRDEPVRVLVRNPAKLAAVGIDAEHANLDVAVGDLLEPATIPPALKGVSRIHHVAGVIALGRGDRRWMYDANVATTRNLLEAARQSEVERIVYLASIFALAGGDREAANETSPWRQQGLRVHYVQAKRAAELYVRECAREGIPIVFVYPCFCYGPGDVYESSSKLIVGFLRGTLGPVYVRGGHNAMDVRDAAAGLILGMERGAVGERYLIGGENVEATELFALLAKITGKPGPRIPIPAAAARIAGRIGERLLKNPPMTEQLALMLGRRWYYDDGKARRKLGYESRPLERTLRDAVQWFRERGIS